MKTNTSRWNLLVGGSALVLVMVSTHATPIVYSGVDAGALTPGPLSTAADITFNTAAGSLGPPIINIDFESATLGLLPTIVGGVALTATPGTAISATQICPLFGCNTTTGGSKYVYMANAGFLTFTFATGIQAFGAYLTGVQLNGSTINYFDGLAESVPVPSPGFGGGVEFVGFTNGPHPNGPPVECFRTVTVNARFDLIGVDDVRYVPCQGTVIPEPLPLSLVGLGLLGIAGARNRNRSAMPKRRG